MRRAIDLSVDFTKALQQSQADTLAKLDAIAAACSKQAKQLQEAHDENVRAMRVQLEESTSQIRDIREQALALAAAIRDGDDDMARGIAEVFGRAKAEPLGEADDETKALAIRLAPAAAA